MKDETNLTYLSREEEKLESENEKLEVSSNGDASDHSKGSKVGEVRTDSDSGHITSASTDETDIESPPLTEIKTNNSVPASVFSHPANGADLEKGPTGPQNNTVDEEGKIVVNWTSRTDPENPKNWPRQKKIFNVVIISMMTFLCPLSSSMFVSPSSRVFDNS